MQSICLYLHIHQPHRIKNYGFFNIGKDHSYFNDNSTADTNNQKIINKVALKSYLPTIKVLKKLLQEHHDFKFALSFSGTILEQFQNYHPNTLKAFQELVSSERVEILADTYYHSLAFFYSLPEFEKQVKLHHDIIWKLFKKNPKVFRNTELSYRNDLGKWINQNGYIGILAEGWDPLLNDRSPNQIYHVKNKPNTKILLKNYKLSDDIAFRFSQQSWNEYPLNPEKYATWLHANYGNGPSINLFMDFETFGEHQWADSGIFNFLKNLPTAIKKHPNYTFKTPTELIKNNPPSSEYDVPDILTWADTERDLSAWNGNDIQKEALRQIYSLETDILKSNDTKLISDWRNLQTSDHFYYMCTKYWNDGDVHKYFSPYESPYDAYTSFINTIYDVKFRLKRANMSLDSLPVKY